jgi:hypothetical protein
MLRQRIRIRTSPLVYLARAVLILASLGLALYGLALLALALKANPETVNDGSAYRSAYDYLAGVEPADITGQVRLIAGLAGLGTFLVFGFLALKEIPRPYLARGELRLAEDERGVVDVDPRAIERVAEAAARENEAVRSAAARYGTEDLTLNVAVTRARDLRATLRDIRARAREQLERHGLPSLPVHVTITGFERKTRRELR